MKIYVIILSTFFTLTFSLPTSLFSQSTIYGVVQDELSKPQAYCNILLLSTQDSSMVKGSLSNDDGKYQIKNVAPGSYIVKYSMIGFAPYFSSPQRIDSNRKSIDLGIVQLKADAQVLNAIEVKAKKPLYEQKIDRLVVNIQNSITSTGSNALEVLERSPDVIVDRQNSGLSLSGKGGVVVMINGKINYSPIEAVVQMLEGMSADDIEKIN